MSEITPAEVGLGTTPPRPPALAIPNDEDVESNQSSPLPEPAILQPTAKKTDDQPGVNGCVAVTLVLLGFIAGLIVNLVSGVFALLLPKHPNLHRPFFLLGCLIGLVVQMTAILTLLTVLGGRNQIT